MRAGALIKALMAVVVVAFVAWTAWDLGQRWHASPPVDVHLGWGLAAVLPIVGVSLCQALGWHSLMEQMVGRAMPWVASLELFLASMLGRYAPAKVGMPAILMARAEQLELRPSLMASSMVLIVLVYTILGVGIGVAALTLSSAPVLPQIEALGSGLGALALGGMAVAVVLMLVVPRRRYPEVVLDKLGVEGRGPLVGLGMVVWYVGVWACWWAHGVLIVVAVGGTWTHGVDGAGLFVLAPVLGFLALVAPGGLGVREAVLAGGLAASVGPGPAVVAALASRIISLAIDVLMWLGFRAAWRRQQAVRARSSPANTSS